MDTSVSTVQEQFPRGKAASLHDSARGSPEPLEESDTFQQLVKDINTILGPSDGINSAGVDVEELKKLMAAYKSDEEQWSKYAFANKNMAYTRNLVDSGNGKANLLILVWTPGKGSPIHDHANAHCVMKILKGSLTETLYGWPCQNVDNPVHCATAPSSCYPSTKHTCSRSRTAGPLEESELQTIRETTYPAEGVTYMSDRLGLHRIRNPSDTEFAVSLHLYTPPNAATHGCHIYNQQTGKKTFVPGGKFFSEHGVKT